MQFWPMASMELSFMYRIRVDFRIESLSRKQNMRRKPAIAPPLLLSGSESHKPRDRSGSLENVAARSPRSNALCYSCIDQRLDQRDGTLPRSAQCLPNLPRSHASMVSQHLKQLLLLRAQNELCPSRVRREFPNHRPDPLQIWKPTTLHLGRSRSKPTISTNSK